VKRSAIVETKVVAALEFYAHVWGQTVARERAPTSDPIALATPRAARDRFESRSF
jgi:hypothetical protein